jgi:prostaglandin-endoperoxide synthase 2
MLSPMSASPPTLNGADSAPPGAPRASVAGPPRPAATTASSNGSGAPRQPADAGTSVKVRRPSPLLTPFVYLLISTLVEASALYLWLRWHEDGWWAPAVLVAGETLETGVFRVSLNREPRKRWGPPAHVRHGKRLQRIGGLAGFGEIGIWLLWLTAAAQLGWGIAAAGLFVLMHVKHHVESMTVRDVPFRDGLLAARNIVASAAEAAGAVASLQLLHAHHLVLAAVAIGGGILVEHAIQIGVLDWEMRARDVRLPRDPRWKTPSVKRELKLYGLTHFGWAWWAIERIGPLRRFVNRYVINELVSVMEPRPNALSTKTPYTSWSSLTDRDYTGRHLPPVPPAATRPETDVTGGSPSAWAVATLFKRDGDMIPCPKSTVLFGLFAQWFTDGFLRTKRLPGGTRDASLSDSTSEIDLVQLYGRTSEQTQALRAAKHGLLKSQEVEGEEYPPALCRGGEIKPEFATLLTPIGFKGILPADRDRLFAMGTDVTNLGVITFNTLFLREHNRIARLLRTEHPCWTNDQVFETARNTVTVVLLKVVVEDYVNHITPNHLPFRLDPGVAVDARWNRSNWMAIEFNLLYRWHSLVPSTFCLDGRELGIGDLLWTSDTLTDAGLGTVMAAASTQAAGRIGLFNTPDFLVSRADLPSIQQARSARLASYNDYRRLCGLLPAASFLDITDDERVLRALEKTYKTVEDVEFYPGLFAEPPIPNGLMAPLMLAMVAFDAFSQALTNPLLSRQVYNEQTFSKTGWEVIQTTNRLEQIVRRNTPDGSAPHVSFTRRDWVRNRADRR